MNSNIVKTSRKMVDKFFKNLNYKSNKKNTIEVYSRVLGEYLTFIEIQVQINTIEEVDRFFIISFWILRMYLKKYFQRKLKILAN